MKFQQVTSDKVCHAIEFGEVYFIIELMRSFFIAHVCTSDNLIGFSFTRRILISLRFEE